MFSVLQRSVHRGLAHVLGLSILVVGTCIFHSWSGSMKGRKISTQTVKQVDSLMLDEL